MKALVSAREKALAKLGPTRSTTSGNWDATKRLEKAVALTEVSLDELRERELMNLKDDVRNFLWPSEDRRSTGGVWLTDVPSHESITKKVLSNIITGTWRLLGDTVLDRDEQRRKQRLDKQRLLKRDYGTGAPIQKPIEFRSLHLRLIADHDGNCYEELVSAETIEGCFLYVLHHLLIQEGLAKILSCPVCTTQFVRRRRQKQCSRRCTNIANKRAYFERKRLKEERNSARRRRRAGKVPRKK